MRRALALVWLFASLSALAGAQAYTTVTATDVTVDNGTGTAVNPPSGSQLCFLGVNNAGATITYTPSGGSPVTGNVCGTLNGSGGLTGSLQVANPATASPLGLLYTITVINGSTTYLTLPTVSLSGTVWSFDAYALPGSAIALGIGKAHIACAGGAQWTSTTLPPGQNAQLCNISGSWQAYPPAPYCPAGQAYVIPQTGGMPFCVSPTLSSNGAASGTCTQNAFYLEQDNNNLYGCKAGSWILLGTGVSGAVTSIQGAAGAFTFTGSGFSGCSTSGGTTTCTFAGGGGGGSYTNVVASSSADTTVAAINAKCTGGQTYVASIPLSISTGGTINSGCNVSHWYGGVWTIASGQNVTFATPIKEVGAPSTFFAGSGTVTLAAQTVYPQWWGAVGYSKSAVATGTSASTALAAMVASLVAGSKLDLGSNYYRLTSALSDTALSNLEIAGTATAGQYKTNVSGFMQTTVGDDALDFAGVNSIDLHDFDILYSANPTGTATCISVTTSIASVINNVGRNDCIRGAYFSATNNVNVSNSIWNLGFQGFSESGGSGYCDLCFDDAVGPNASPVLDNDIGQTNNLPAITTKGISLTGTNRISDFTARNYVGYQLSYCEYVSTSSSGFYSANDIRFVNSICDAVYTSAAYVNGVSGGAAGVFFTGGWMGANITQNGVTNLFDCENSSGIFVEGVHMSGNVSTSINTPSNAFLYFHNCPASSATGNWAIQAGGGIGLSSSSILVLDGSSTANGSYTTNILNALGGATVFSLVNGASNNTIQPNTLIGSGTGIALCSSCNNNSYADLNNFAASLAAQKNDLGSGNELALGVTSFTGDGVVLNNSASVGAVTATLATHAANLFLGGPASGSAATPTFRALVPADLPLATGTAFGAIKPDESTCTVSAGVLTCTGSSGATSLPICTDSSGSTTAYTCTTSPTFTPVAGSVIAFKPGTSNSGASATLNVNSSSAASIAKWQNTTTLAANDLRAGTYTILTYDGTNWEAQTIGNAPTGGGSSGFPFTILQSANFIFGGSTSFTYTFPNALQSSGATAMLILAVDASGGASNVTTSGWTCTVNVSSGTNYPRLMACLKASAGDTTVTFTTGASASPSLRFYEFSGSRSFDVTSNTGFSSGTPSSLNFPSITPSSGSAVFAVATWVDSTGVSPGTPAIGTPNWTSLEVWDGAHTRLLGGAMYTLTASGSALQPPGITFVDPAYSSSGVAYATFSLK